MILFKYIYGPVPSWRLGSSLGIDLLSREEKICNFDCTYCQLGRNSFYTTDRKKLTAVNEVVEELKTLPKVQIDFMTFSGRGEPALAGNLGEAIKTVKKYWSEPVAVLTNSSLMYDKKVRAELCSADFVVCKLDACSQQMLEKINRPDPKIKFDKIINGIKQFKAEFRGRLALQMMFLEENKNHVEELVLLAEEIQPHEVQINTPLRPCAAKPLSEDEILEIKKQFKNVYVVSVYEAGHKKVSSISPKDTLRRRGKI